MAAQVVTASRTESDRIGPSWTRLVHLLLLFTVFMLLLLTTWLLVRRMDGQLRQPLGFLPLAVVGIAAAALASLLRWAWYQTGLRPRHWKSRTTLCWIVPSIAVLMFAMSLSITGTGTAALVFFWGTLLVVEGAWWWFTGRLLQGVGGSTPVPRTGSSHTLRDTSSNATRPSVASDETSGNTRLGDAETGDSDADDSLPHEVSQQLTRCWAEEDHDTVTGVLRAIFEPGRRSQSLHVAFCPPMLWRPKVAVVQLSGPRARIKAADVQSFGIRFDLRLVTAGQTKQDVLIHFEARCSEPDTAGLSRLQQ